MVSLVCRVQVNSRDLACRSVMPFRLLLDPRVAPLVSGHERGTAGTAVSSPTVLRNKDGQAAS
jgi:hypothetical protein